MNLRDLYGVGTKLKNNIFKNNSQINSVVTNMGFVNRMDQYVVKYWYPNEKWWWFPFVSMVDVVIQGALVLYRINKN